MYVVEGMQAGDFVALYASNVENPRQQFIYNYQQGPFYEHISSVQQPNLVFDIDGPSNATGARIHLWGSYNPPVRNQQWLYNNATLRITSQYNGLCLGVANAYPGAALALTPCTTNSTDSLQQFTYSTSAHSFCLATDASLCLQAGDIFLNCSVAPFNRYAYCNTSLPIDFRIDDLVSRMTPDEKTAALDSSSPAIPRLAVPALPSGEGLHGLVSGCLDPDPQTGSSGCPTSFPCPMAMGATFDVSLWSLVGSVIGTEARAMYNLGHGSMWLFAPNINPARDPRWGRNQEVPSEDPLVVSKYAEHFISGMQQGPDKRYILAASTAKHLAIYDLEGYMPRTDPQPRPRSSTCDTLGGCQRWNFDASPPKADYASYYMAPFEAAIKNAKVRSVMCSYNAQYGIPSCGYGQLQEDILRKEWGWDGHVVSDFTAIELMQDKSWNNCPPPFPPTHCIPDDFPSHNYTHTVEETANVALKAGTDVDLGPLFNMWLSTLVANKSISENLINRAVKRFFRTHFLLGLFDNLADQPYASFNASLVDSKWGRDAALSAARKSVVLLKNDGNILPLRTLQWPNSSTYSTARHLRVAFIGPHANSTQSLLSNYHGDNTLVNTHSPLQVAQARGWDVRYAKGCNICDVVPPGFPNMPCPPGKAQDRSGFQEAVEVARGCDVAIVFVGLDQTSEAENFDRQNISLPGVQEDLVRTIVSVQPNTVVVFISGGSVSSEWISSHVPGILEAFYGGEFGGDAIVDILAGTVSPSGKLPVTMYFPNITARDIREVDLAAAGGITHLYFRGKVLFPFGFGLSYTTFEYNVEGTATAIELLIQTLDLNQSNTTIPLPRVLVHNNGSMTSDCVVLGFVEAMERRNGMRDPSHALFDFARLHSLNPGESRTHQLSLYVEALASYTRDGDAWLFPGAYSVTLGDVVSPARLSLVLHGKAAPFPQKRWVKRLFEV